jgi:large subunit ribosomal protein L5e
VIQDQNKYGTPKYRLIVRFTNRDIVCQVAYTGFKGDVIVASAYAHELTHFGIPTGHNNHAAAYATGLLVARRVLHKFGLSDTYEGNTEPDGSDYNVEPVEDGPRPFHCILDTGLKATTTGSKIFTALKGALDGGLDIPHSDKRMIGYDPEAKKFDADMMRGYIYGEPISEYIEYLEEEDPDKLKAQFKSYIEEEIAGDDIEDMYSDAHEKIRENPIIPKKPRAKTGKSFNQPKLSWETRKANLKAKLAELLA